MTKPNPLNRVSGTLATDITDTTSTAVIAAQGAGVRVVLTSIVVSCSHATQGSVVKVLDGSTVKARFFVKALTGPSPIPLPEDPLVGTANTAWNLQAETTGSAIQAFFAGHKELYV